MAFNREQYREEQRNTPGPGKVRAGESFVEGPFKAREQHDCIKCPYPIRKGDLETSIRGHDYRMEDGQMIEFDIPRNFAHYPECPKEQPKDDQPDLPFEVPVEIK